MSVPGASNSILPTALCILGFLTASATTYAIFAGEAASQPSTNNGEQKPVIQTASARIPPIDRELPEKIETATFAMG